jgi:ABC-2 type transport system ATP-binding protein
VCGNNFVQSSITIGKGQSLMLVDDVSAALSKRYGKQPIAVDDLNLTIRKGEIYGFLGPNGAGKTTTLRMLLGLIRPTSSTGKILGKPLGTAEGLTRMRC